MEVWKIVLIVAVVIVAVLAGLYFWGVKLQKKYDEQQTLIDQNKQVAQIFVIDKKKDKITNVKLPKQVKDEFPKRYKKKKMPIVIAKIGPQITTLLCDEKIYNDLPVKKQVKVELAGLFIVGIRGPKAVGPAKKQGWIDKLKSKVQKKD